MRQDPGEDRWTEGVLGGVRGARLGRLMKKNGVNSDPVKLLH